ncbi:MAG: SGNH/GDSL hydrolase family protein [Phormidesmis sp. CAN_BIN36]|nr:SGNH/GDSL hydrolase family protein [Phormidesmis sp. CAN_BIN36]
MFRTSRKPYRSSLSSYQKKKRSLPRWAILSALPIALLTLELLARLITSAIGKAPELTAFEGEPLTVTAYRLNYLDQSGSPYDGLPDRGRLTAKRSPLMGYKLIGNQKSSFWQINEQGFRTNQPVTTAKAKDETRIFVLGGSMAFGQMSSNNQSTFTAQLEKRLNEQVTTQKTNSAKFRPDVLPYFADDLSKAMALPPRIRDSRYRVVNAAVPGYASSNELSQLALQVLSYKPDFIVVLDGYADLLLPSTQEGADIPGIESLLDNSFGHFTTTLSERFKNWMGQSFLIKSVQYWVLRPQDSLKLVVPPAIESDGSLSQKLSANDDELNRRVSRYRNNLEQIVRLTSGAKIPIVLALQPEITSRSANPTPLEEKILDQVGSAYPQQVKAGYAQLQQAIDQVKQQFPQRVTTLNLNEGTKFQGQTFHDTIHLTDAGNTAIANRLYDAITTSLTMQPKPYGNQAPLER